MDGVLGAIVSCPSRRGGWVVGCTASNLLMDVTILDYALFSPKIQHSVLAAVGLPPQPCILFSSL